MKRGNAAKNKKSVGPNGKNEEMEKRKTTGKTLINRLTQDRERGMSGTSKALDVRVKV